MRSLITYQKNINAKAQRRKESLSLVYARLGEQLAAVIPELSQSVQPHDEFLISDFGFSRQSGTGGFVPLKVYDITGAEVATVVSEQLSPGNHEYLWDARGFASGVYFYRLTVGEFSAVRKMLLVR